MIETQTIEHKHKDGRWVREHIDRLENITYTSNFDLDQAMYDWGRDENWDDDTFADADDCKDNGYMMIGEWLEDNEFDYDG